MTIAKRIEKFRMKFGRYRQRLDLYLAYLQSLLRKRDPSTILVIRRDGLGDFILSLESARAIREHYPRPRYRIVLAANAVLVDLAMLTKYFDDVIPLDMKLFPDDNRYTQKILRQIGDLRADVAINLSISRIKIVDRIIRASGAKRRIGFDGMVDTVSQSPGELKRHSRWYTDLIPSKPGSHEIESNKLLADFFEPSDKPIRPRLKDIRHQQRVQLPEKFFTLFPGSSSPHKNWPADRFAEIARRIQQQTGWPVVICGAADEAVNAEIIKKKLEEKLVIDLCGRTDIADLVPILQNSELALGNDTGLAHLAAALDCPVVVPFGGWHFGRFFPYPNIENEPPIAYPVFRKMPCFNCSWNCIYPKEPDKAFRCLDEVSIEDAWKTVKSIIDRSTKLASNQQ